MHLQEIAPIGMIVLSILAAIGYALVHDWRHAIYWTASATIIASVTF